MTDFDHRAGEGCGFLEYALDDRPSVRFASRGLCQLLGVSGLTGPTAYPACILPSDQAGHGAFLARLGQRPRKECLQYRIRDKNGRVWSVREEAVSFLEADGRMIAEAQLSYAESRETAEAPWGFLRCTCEKKPRLLEMNESLRRTLGIPQARPGETDYLELYRENLLLLLPLEERRRFCRYLEQLCTADTPLYGELSLLRCDSTHAHVFGWITRDPGCPEEFQAVCLDVSRYYESRKAQSARRYLNALMDVYDKIYQYDLGDGSLKCLYDSKEARFRWLQNLPMQMEEATEKWVTETVVPAQQERVLNFFRAYLRNQTDSEAGPSRITYEARSSSGEIRSYQGTFLKMDSSIRLYCCRCIEPSRDSAALSTENASLRKNMQALMMEFTDGAAAFQIADDLVTPLYITDNVCGFFGKTREQWLPLMERATPVREFVAQARVDYGQFEALLRDGEAEFTYLDGKTNTRQQIRAICSHRSAQPGVPRYVMLYRTDGAASAQPHVYIRTFGYFDVFVDETPIAFRNRKSKELFALLVDRQGGFVTSEEAISYLWEEEPVSPVTLARYRKVALRLKNTLTEYGIAEVVEAVDGKRRIVPQRIRCDLYEYLSGREEYAQLFKGSYLSNYSWGETTLAELSGMALGSPAQIFG